jgi:hypothetical protein
MKIALLLFCFALILCPSLHAASVLQPGDRIAICGDAMTNNHGSSDYIEDYLLGCQPVQDINIAAFGSSMTTHDFLARLNTDLLPYKPSVVLLNFGVFDDPNTYRQSLTDLVDALKKAGVRVTIVASPRCADSTQWHHDPAASDARNKVLAGVADIAKDVAAKEGVIYADVFDATMAAMKKLKAEKGDSFIFDADAVWGPTLPQTVVITYAILKAMGFDGDLGTITADFAAGKADATPGHTVVSFQNNQLAMESSLVPFCLGMFPTPDDKHDLFPNYVPFNEDLNRFTLVTKNLPTARTKISWQDGSQDFNSNDLAKGVNLAATTTINWACGPFQNIQGRVAGLREQERVAGDAAVQGKADPNAAQKREAAYQDIIAHRVPAKYTLTIQPLAEIAKQPPGPIPVIVDTDMASDCDDVGALALLNSFMVQGEANLIACITNVRNGDSGAVCQAIDAYYGHGSIPVGSYQGENNPAVKMTSVLAPAPPEGYHGEGRKDGSHYTVAVHKQFVPDFPTDDKLPAGVDVYRKALASAKDGTVVIVSLGLMQNIQDLIQSQPDSVSPLNGVDLVKKKVREMVVMANTVHEDAYLLSKWPTRIVWTTFIGSYVGAGKSLQNTPENNPVRVAYGLFGDDPQHSALSGGRQCWDLTAAWLAVRGPGDLWDEISGTWKVDPPGGYGTFINDVTKNDRLAIYKMPNEEVSRLIEAELSRPPKP